MYFALGDQTTARTTNITKKSSERNNEYCLFGKYYVDSMHKISIINANNAAFVQCKDVLYLTFGWHLGVQLSTQMATNELAAHVQIPKGIGGAVETVLEFIRICIGSIGTYSNERRYNDATTMNERFIRATVDIKKISRGAEYKTLYIFLTVLWSSTPAKHDIHGCCTLFRLNLKWL